ncbi:hypothetical protein QTP88_011811 [Uroleucon formosanum]
MVMKTCSALALIVLCLRGNLVIAAWFPGSYQLPSPTARRRSVFALSIVSNLERSGFSNKDFPKFDKILKVSLENCDHLLKFHNQQIIKDEKVKQENTDVKKIAISPIEQQNIHEKNENGTIRINSFNSIENTETTNFNDGVDRFDDMMVHNSIIEIEPERTQLMLSDIFVMTIRQCIYRIIHYISCIVIGTENKLVHCFRMHNVFIRLNEIHVSVRLFFFNRSMFTHQNHLMHLIFLLKRDQRYVCQFTTDETIPLFFFNLSNLAFLFPILPK